MKRRFMNRFIGAAVLALLLAAGLGACGGNGDSTGSSTEAGTSTADSTTASNQLEGTIDIGAVLPLTGPNASIGEDQRRGIELAVEDVNANGGVLGKELVAKVEDSEGTPTAAVNAAKKLVKVDEVPVVLGEYSSSNTIPMDQYLQSQGVISLNGASSAPEVAEIGDFAFSTVALDPVAGKFVADQLYKELDVHDIALLAPNNSYGVGITSAVESEFEKLGGTIATKVLYTEGESEYRQDLQRIQAADPEMIVYTAYGTEAQIINKESYELGIDPATLYGIYVSQNIADADPQATNGQIGMDLNYIGPNGAGYKEAYESKFGSEFKTSFSGYMYDGVMLAVQAMEDANSAEPSAIRTALDEIGKKGYDGATGQIKWDPDGQRVYQAYTFEEVVDGKPEETKP